MSNDKIPTQNLPIENSPTLSDYVIGNRVSDGKTVQFPFPLKYKSYTALLTQTGTNAPTAFILNNDTGLTITFSYIGIGDYRAVLSSSISTFKCVVMPMSQDNFQTEGINYCYLENPSSVTNSQIIIQSKKNFITGSDNKLVNAFFEFRIY